MISFHAASYYPEYGDPIATAVAICTCPIVAACDVHQRLETACEEAAEQEHQDYVEMAGDDDSCPPIIAGQAFTYRAKELFSAAELKEHRRALMAGEIVWLRR